ncbi:amidohydrolase family protein [Jiangella mangrovi]|uniref:amidohydrolase family protein n=1 Tax=Jiangella mangrovi TaxID=1524084 RepID=UPI001C883ECC
MPCARSGWPGSRRGRPGRPSARPWSWSTSTRSCGWPATWPPRGGNVGAGTDCGTPFVFPGLAVHDELELLVRAGLSPMRALQAATRDAARCAEQEDVAGTVTAGRRADLLVLDADPLADIRNTRRIHAVVARGRYLGPGQRQRIFDQLEQAAQEA